MKGATETTLLMIKRVSVCLAGHAVPADSESEDDDSDDSPSRAGESMSSAGGPAGGMAIPTANEDVAPPPGEPRDREPDFGTHPQYLLTSE